MTLHTQVENYIMSHIQDGTWKTGDQIPTEMSLAALLGVSRPTVRNALTRLAGRGYLVRTKGKGSFVSQPKLLHRSTTMLSGYRQESEANGLQIHTDVISLKELRAGDKLAKKLHIRPQDKVGMLTRLRRVEGYHNGRPVVLTTLYIPMRKIPDFLEHDFSNESFYRLLDERGLSVQHASRTLDVVLPAKAEAKLLEISPFDPLIRITSSGTAKGGAAVEYTESLYPALLSSFQIELDR